MSCFFLLFMCGLYMSTGRLYIPIITDNFLFFNRHGKGCEGSNSTLSRREIAKRHNIPGSTFNDVLNKNPKDSEGFPTWGHKNAHKRLCSHPEEQVSFIYLQSSFILSERERIYIYIYIYIYIHTCN